MVALTHLRMHDLARQRRVDVDLAAGDLSPAHTVGHAVDLFRERAQIPDYGSRWSAFSRGVALDSKSRLGDLPEIDADWTVMPEVSAG